MVDMHTWLIFTQGLHTFMVDKTHCLHTHMVRKTLMVDVNSTHAHMVCIHIVDICTWLTRTVDFLARTAYMHGYHIQMIDINT